MTEIIAYAVGFAFAFLGTLIPGVLNGMIVQQQAENGKKTAREFMMGSIVTVVLQAWIALTFSSYLSIHPKIYSSLKQYAIVLLLTLAVYFYYKARNKNKPKAPEKPKYKFKLKNNYLKGALFACLNIFPFFAYVVVGVLAEEEKWFSITPISTVFVCLGVASASYVALELYRIVFQNKTENESWVLRNIYAILSTLTLGISLYEFLKIVWNP